MRCCAQTLREAAQRGGRPGAEVAGAEGAGGHLHAVAGALGALGMDTLKEFEARLYSVCRLLLCCDRAAADVPIFLERFCWIGLEPCTLQGVLCSSAGPAVVVHGDVRGGGAQRPLPAAAQPCAEGRACTQGAGKPTALLPMLHCHSLSVPTLLLNSFSSGQVNGSGMLSLQGLPEGQAPEGFGPKEAAPVIKDFAARWTSALEALHRCRVAS